MILLMTFMIFSHTRDRDSDTILHIHLRYSSLLKYALILPISRTRRKSCAQFSDHERNNTKYSTQSSSRPSHRSSSSVL